MATATKVPNYTPEQTAAIVAAYVADKSKATVESLATKFGKTTRSIVAKLAKEGVYEAKVYVSKTGEKPVKKDEHADAIGTILRLTESETESLTKANKTALAKIFTALAMSKPLENGEDRAGEVAPEIRGEVASETAGDPQE